MVTFRNSLALSCIAGAFFVSAFVSDVARANETKVPSKENAKQLVAKAMAAEIAGDFDQRSQRLAEAFALKDDTLAHSQLGLMKINRSEWQNIDAAAARLADSAAMRRYEALRSRLVDTADGHWNLAKACIKAKIADRAQAHLQRVIQLEPDHLAARAALGYRKFDGEWVSPQRIAEAEKLEKDIVVAVEKHGKFIGEILPLLRSSQAWERDRGVARLFSLVEPSAALAAEKLISPQSNDLAAITITFLGTIQDPIATQALLRHAMRHDSAAVRIRAAQELKHRDLHAYAPRLLAALSLPIKSEVEAIVGPRGEVTGYRQVFQRVGMERTQVLTTKTDITQQAKTPNESRLSALRRTPQNDEEANQIAKASLTEASVQYERLATLQNERIAARNARIFDVLRVATGVDLPSEPQAWWNWYDNQIGVETEGRDYTLADQQQRRQKIAQESQRQLVAFGPTAWSPADSGNRFRELPPRRKECFVAGTLVTTHRGGVKIEEVQIGDMVLSKNITSGELAFRPVLQVTVRDPEDLIAIQAGEELLRCTKGHLFWVSGRGWLKAGDLTEGMVLHAAENPLRVNRLMAGGKEETFNLRVADNANYFVGNARILSHDVSSRGPTEMEIPGYNAPRDRK